MTSVRGWNDSVYVRPRTRSPLSATPGPAVGDHCARLSADGGAGVDRDRVRIVRDDDCWRDGTACGGTAWMRTRGSTETGPQREARERQRLLRYANEVAVANSMTGLARLPALPDASAVVRTFDCECADPTCDALVDLSVSDAATALTGPPPSLLAPGHHPVQ